MKTADFNYGLPTDLIAQTPLEPRDASRLLVLHRDSGDIEHRTFSDLPVYLRAGDVLVFNDTRVIPARLRCRRKTGARVELLLLRERGECLWEALVSPGRVKAGEAVLVEGHAGTFEVQVGEYCGASSRLVRFPAPELVERAGEVPLPPYIHTPLAEAGRYQTVYARVKGSAAAPTAGLHFTPGLLEQLRRRGIRFAFVTLHIGLDTFLPVREDDPREHQIHREYGEVSAEAASVVRQARDEKKRVVCVGTTSVRLVEGVAARFGDVVPFSGEVDLLILPGFPFKVTDAIITNFHLPRSTLLMLVSAFSGRDLVLHAYQEATDRRYRFYSFGDAMLIV